jgi:hypothetical protein
VKLIPKKFIVKHRFYWQKMKNFIIRNLMVMTLIYKQNMKYLNKIILKNYNNIDFEGMYQTT